MTKATSKASEFEATILREVNKAGQGIKSGDLDLALGIDLSGKSFEELRAMTGRRAACTRAIRNLIARGLIAGDVVPNMVAGEHRGSWLVYRITDAGAVALWNADAAAAGDRDNVIR